MGCALQRADAPSGRPTPCRSCTTPIPHCDRFFVADPDLNRIEIIQWLRSYDPSVSGAATLDGLGAAGDV